MMRLVIAANSDLSYDQRLQRIARSLKKNGMEVHLLGRAFFQSPSLNLPDLSAERVSLRQQKGKWAYLELNLRLFRRLLDLEADAICSVDLDTLPACVLAGQWRSIPVFHDAHEYMEEVPEVVHRPLTKGMWEWIARIFLPFTRMRYTVSASLCVEMEHRYGLPFGLVRNIARTPSPRERVETEPKPGYWVFLGAVNEGRGLEEFLPLLHRSTRDLVVVGDGDVREKVESLVRELGLENRVWFTGKRLPEEAAAWVRDGFAGLNLLRGEGLSYRYSLANKFFDYVQAGIPQLSMDFPEYRLLMDEHPVGVLVKNLDPENLAHAMDELEKRAATGQFREPIREARQHWTWEAEEKRLLAYYQPWLERVRR